MSSFSGNGSVHGFYRLKALIILEQVITSMVRLTGLAMSMRFIFGDHGFLDFCLLTHAF